MNGPAPRPSRRIEDLLAIMAALRTPETGCPWDLAQDFATIAPYTVEEACEVADAIARADMPDLCDELGDLLFQVVFHARLAQERGAFEFGDVVEAITSKMIRRHPHVFGDETGILAQDVPGMWDRIKSAEKAARAARRAEAGLPEKATSLLDGVPGALPGLPRAVKLTGVAAKVGFDWPGTREVIAKIREELDEVEAVLDHPDKEELEGEIGDLLFAVANLARQTGIDPEAALRSTNMKFMRRFAHIEQALAQAGRPLPGASLEEMDALWNEAKRAERGEK